MHFFRKSQWMAGLLAAGLFATNYAAVAGATGVNDSKEIKETAAPESRYKFYGWLDAGVTFNPDNPASLQNFGRLFDDRVNEPLLNQFMLTAERPLDPKAAGFDWGFKLQGGVGSDARFIHSVGLFDLTTRERVQPDLIEGYLNLHLPIITKGGLDMKLGKWVTLEGIETIDPRPNFFYSHTYIYNFGIPFNDTGALATLHATKWLDLYASINRGVNTSIEDNNASVAFEGGFGLNFWDGKLTVIASTHFGPETPHDNHDFRYLNDIATTWKITDKLTWLTDLNYCYDEGATASCYGIAQYFTYSVNDWISAGIRGEVFRDDKGFYVTQFAANNDPMHALRGDTDWVPDPHTVSGGEATYSAITVGVNIKIPVPKPLGGLVIRPEVRYDHTLNGAHTYSDLTSTSMFTAGIDAILTF